MNNEQKLEMINMCVAALLERKQLHLSVANNWVDSHNNISDVVRNIVTYNMQYRVKPAVKKEPEPEKFKPFKGQIVRVTDIHNPERRYTRKFSHMKEGRFVCHMDETNPDSFISWDYCWPIPNVVQFRPMSELDPEYDGKLNVLYANGKTCSFMYAGNRYIGADWVPVGFQLLEE